MTAVFVDTSYWLACLNPRDSLHWLARQVARPEELVTTWAVLLEVMDALSSPPHCDAAVEFWAETFSDPALEAVPLDGALLEKGIRLFSARPDKAWSLTDCISGLTDALSADHHFEQAGFRILLKP